MSEITQSDAVLISQLVAERERLEEEAQRLRDQAAYLSDEKIGEKFNTTAQHIRKIARFELRGRM